MPVLKVCAHCQKDFKVSPRRHEEVKYCSRVCKTEAGYARYKCEVCSTQFKRKWSDNAESKQRFCSRSCYHSVQKGRKLSVDPDAPRYYATCGQCQTVFRTTKTRQTTARWCSKKCQVSSPLWRQMCSEVQQGEKHWRWSGGKYQFSTGYVREKRNVNGQALVRFEHQRVVLEAMLRECPGHPFIVESAGRHKLHRDIEVHHIDRDRANNALENLLAVTKDAHAQIHHRNRKPQPWECWPPNPSRW